VLEFLAGIFDHKAYKMKEAKAKKLMEVRFNERDEEHAYYRGLVLDEGQIKGWLSSEKKRRQDRAARKVVNQAITSLALDIDSAAPEEEVAIQDSNLTEVGERGGSSSAHDRGSSETEMNDASHEEETCVKNDVPFLWIVVREIWKADDGFIIWEIEDDELLDGVKVMPCEYMEGKCMGRKWVHEACLLDKSQKTSSAVALKDKGSGASSLLLGKVGERRFGPRLGRAHAFTEIVPGWCVCVFIFFVLLNVSS
jgi:hypothetical protein